MKNLYIPASTYPPLIPIAPFQNDPPVRNSPVILKNHRIILESFFHVENEGSKKFSSIGIFEIFQVST
jgi:hypothetical protein